LKPPDDEPPQSRAWRVYDLLSLMYLRQFDREAVANQLGISERQLRREQRLAIETLAQHLWQLPKVGAARQAASPGQRSDAAHAEGETAAAGAPDASPPPASPPPEPRLPLGEALENVRSLALPLAQQGHVPLKLVIAADVVAQPVPPMALRTILLAVLTLAIPLAGAGAVVITARARAGEIAVTVTCDDPAAARQPLAQRARAALATVQQQAAFYAARLEIAGEEQGGLHVTLLLAALQQAVVLVIDDNTDWLALVQRYADGSPVQVAVTAAPEAAGALAGKLQPALIVLDVMMHNVDGWQVLSELRHDPATAHIPVVVCTILPLGEMALALGATAFLQKPVSQQQFLQLLARYAGA
jgi:CheY-like chemotaxis protein